MDTMMEPENDGVFDGEGTGMGGTFGPDDTYMGVPVSSLPSGILGARPKVRLTEEEVFAQNCARRRQNDLERRARIFDAKRRMIGVDKEALDAQVREKQERKAADDLQAKFGDRDMIKLDKQLKQLEIDKQRSRRNQEVESKEYSLQNIHFASRREFDLNDPLAKRKDIPARVGDHDPRCGPSSMQKFSGEDLMKDERVRQQQLATVSFVEQQKFEKSMLARRPDDEFILQMAEVTALRNEIEENELALRQDMQRSQQASNLSHIAENEEKKCAQVRATMEANERELNFHASDKFLNECAPSHYNNRVIRDAYKGATRDQRVDVAAQQRNQVADNERLKAANAQQEREFNNAAEMTRQQLVALERSKQRKRRELKEQMAQDNLKMQAENHIRLKETNRLFTNEFSPQFFEQFGTGCR